MFLGLISTFAKLAKEKLVKGAVLLLAPTPILNMFNKCNFEENWYELC